MVRCWNITPGPSPLTHSAVRELPALTTAVPAWGMGGEGRERGKGGSNLSLSVFRTLDPHRTTALAQGSEKTSELDASAGSSVK